jgi:hypothetical protein
MVLSISTQMLWMMRNERRFRIRFDNGRLIYNAKIILKIDVEQSQHQAALLLV